MSTPIRFANPDDDFELREVMVPMRDGICLRTLILTPKFAREPLPMLLQRTPYDASKRLPAKQRTALHSVLGPGFAELRDYIFVFQDIRGRYGSQGDFEINRPPRGVFNSTETDETTDAWDTAEWLVNNVQQSNRRIGIHGTSYEGWTTLMTLLDPHPAVRAAVPVNPMVDCWMGDDWFHNGAFRQAYAFEYVHSIESDPKSPVTFSFSHYDTYTWWLNAGSPVKVGKRYLDETRHRFWKVLMENPAYSTYWQSIALDRLLQQSKATLIPTLHVHSWFDQEDSYGAPAAYAAMKPRDDSNTLVYFAAGPWYHGQSWLAGDKLGAVVWNEDAARHWREDQLTPFLAHYLKDGPAHDVALVTVFNTGSRRWEKPDSWPRPKTSRKSTLYFAPENKLSWQPPSAPEGVFQSYVSDPSKPVPYQPRPVRRISDDELDPAAWRVWLTGDQRFVDGRPDVLTYAGDPLETPVTVRGDVTVRLLAETTGTDVDWVVKLIDAFADLEAAEPGMSGFQLMISGDILRGRYRRQFDRAEPVAANEVLEYTISLPQVNHTFQRGHRIMVQVQSTWFPLYDRNPQRFVPSIMEVEPDDYQSATHRIHTSAVYPSRIEINVEEH